MTSNPTDTEASDALLRIGDAARQLNVSVDTLRRWAEDGKISPVTMPSGHRRFPQSEIDRVRGAA